MNNIQQKKVDKWFIGKNLSDDSYYHNYKTKVFKLKQ